MDTRMMSKNSGMWCSLWVVIVVDRDSVVQIVCGEIKDVNEPKKLRRVNSRGQVGRLTD